MDVTQRDLDFATAEQERSKDTAAERREDKLDALMAPVIDAIGPKHFAEVLGIGVKNVDRLYHWKQRRNGQRPPAELLLAVVTVDEKAMAAFCDLAGYEAPKKRNTLSPEEQIRALRLALQRFGEAGEAEYQRAVFGSPTGVKR